MSVPNRQPRSRRGPDYYQVLGLHPTATVEQVKAAFRRQALLHHPDKNSGSEAATEQFKICNDAFAVLSDPAKRVRYDWSRENQGVTEIARDIFDELLGTRRRRRLAGRDLHYTLELTFQEAALGVTRNIRFPVPERCEVCGGNGAAPGATRSCPSCGGKGESREKLGLLVLPRPCPRCGGQGISVVKPCASCSGIGTTERTREYVLRLEAGVADGSVRVVSGCGEAGRDGAAAGDLRILVRVAQHPLFVVAGSDLRLELPVRYLLLVVGGTVEVPTLEGTARMRIPPGTQSGRIFRLAGKGGPRGKGRGDLLVTVQAETPANLDDRAMQALNAFDQACSASSLPRVAGFLEALDKLKQIS